MKGEPRKRSGRTFLWRLDERQAAIYTEDRQLAVRLGGDDRLPLPREEEWATYRPDGGRAFAWQALFPTALWARLVRLVGRERLTVLDEPPPRKKKAAQKVASRPVGAQPATPSPRGKKRAQSSERR